MEKEKLKQIIADVENTAKKAGLFIAEEAKKFSVSKVEYKDVNNVVSYVDKEAEKMIVASLSELLPSAGFITEEGTADTDDLDALNWIIDPLDGTANFIHGVPNYSVSLALAKGKEVLLGVIYHIPADEMYTAIKGNGAFCNGAEIRVAASKKLGESLLATGFPYYKFDHMEDYLQILESLMQKTHGLRRFGSAAIDLAYVAKGHFDGFYEYNLNSWDMAAGVLLVQEAGGKVTDFKGADNFLFGGDVVAGNAVHAELLDEINRFWN
ncbi:inositol monophosphatase [Marinilongibacter aquaticus]|uniref:inositol monophosphatase family protein n=1 Tax=Marinilongibacter aquaticus TaxID=2975157 RepID=UPI0021BD9430|nr:inositol monophosphatase family protein [Marinilongibacter aquaticus]UBM59405.1 inositol monophosphatase [Marinilongibacter aquaticus]